jgi:hypothetical protein
MKFAKFCAAAVSALALFVPSTAGAGVITYSTDFLLGSSYSLGMTGAFSIQLDDFKLIELPRYAGADPLTGVAINLSSASYRHLFISSTDDWPNEELVSILPPVWEFYGNEASVEGTIDGELTFSLLNPANVSRIVHFPKISAACGEKTMDEERANLVSCVAENSVTNPYNADIPVAAVPLADFTGADPIRFLAVLNGFLSGLCGGPDPGNFGVDYDDCGSTVSYWLWEGSISVTYTYAEAGTTGGSETTGGGEATDDESTGEVPEPLGLVSVGVALSALRRVVKRNRLPCGKKSAAGVLAGLALLVPNAAHSETITYSTVFSLSAKVRNVNGEYASFGIDLSGDTADIEVPRYSGAEPLTGVSISLSSQSSRTVTDLYAEDFSPDAEHVGAGADGWSLYDNDASVEGALDGELGITLLDPLSAEAGTQFPKLSAACQVVLEADPAVAAVCSASTSATDNYNADIAIPGIPLANFVGSDPLNFYLAMAGWISGRCGDRGPGLAADLDDRCGVGAARWDWRGSLSVTYTYGAGDTNGSDTTGGGETTGGGSTSEVPEPAGLVAIGVALTGLRRLLR